MEAINKAMEYNQQGRLLYSMDKYEEALEYYKRAETEDPMCMDTYFNMGEVYVMLDKYDEAREAFKKVLLIDKNNGVTYFHLGNVEFLCDNNTQGKEYYAKAVNNGFVDYQLYYNLASVYEEEGKTEDAIKNYNKAIKLDNTMPEAKFRKAQIYLSTHNYPEAMQALDAIILNHPDVFEGYHYKVMLLIETEKYDEAEILLQRAIDLFPDDEAFLFDKVLLLEKKGQYDDALQILNNISDENSRDILVEKGKIYLAKGNESESISCFESVIDNEGNLFDDETRFYLINIYRYKKDYAKVLEYCQQIIDVQNENTYYYSAVFFKAEAINNSESEGAAKPAIEEALKVFRSGCSKTPGFLNLYVYRALCYKTLKDYSNAMEMVNYVLALDENLGDAYLIRSEIYKDLNEPEKAEEDRKVAESKGIVLSVIK